jgi:hypothetical protein
VFTDIDPPVIAYLLVGTAVPDTLALDIVGSALYKIIYNAVHDTGAIDYRRGVTPPTPVAGRIKYIRVFIFHKIQIDNRYSVFGPREIIKGSPSVEVVGTMSGSACGILSSCPIDPMQRQRLIWKADEPA